ncbi:MAG: N-succinylarginine dihydrolase [Candidatus Omnitrophica bacterium]|nr:N-succinylarginine dihydrolase [Candidatus Omnitrophota bacterium]
MFHEYNFDGLIGPSHNFAGLATGNFAAMENRYAMSSPRRAALQGLVKMKLLHNLGVKQGFIPPQARPDFVHLRQLGYAGTDAQILEKVAHENFGLLLEVSSASSMWAANAATVSPSVDTRDKKIHITPANLRSHPHRSIEVKTTADFLKMIFRDQKTFIHHPYLLNDDGLLDEGAANHMRLCAAQGEEGLEIFVYGKSQVKQKNSLPQKYSARQTLEASSMIAHKHQLASENTVFIQQNPMVIDQGVFHNDVISSTHENILLIHEEAFVDQEDKLNEIQERFNHISKRPLDLIEIKSKDLSVKEAVGSYFFNSQIVSLPDSSMALIAPQECQDYLAIHRVIEKIVNDRNPIKKVHFVNLSESMRNGGGPACLRLRVVADESQGAGIHSGFIFNDEKIKILESWINRSYRDQLHLEDLADYEFVKESQKALSELTTLLGTGAIYNFQKE